MSLWRLLPVGFLIVPIVEIAVIIQVGQVIGLGPTVVLLLAESALGAWLVKREGASAWGALTSSLRTGHLPTRELTDAALVLVGGTLLLTPGFVTDVVGFFLILPFTRPIARRALQGYLARRAVQAAVTPRPRPGAQPSGPFGGHFGGTVVQGEVIDPESPRDPPGR